MDLDQAFKDAGIEVEHHFSDGLYIKKTTIPAGVTLVQHRHNYAHSSVVVSGCGTLTSESLRVDFVPGDILNIPARKAHSVLARTRVVWLCIHATDITDVDLLGSALIDGVDETYV